MSDPKFVVIGGGTGISVLLRGMKRFTDDITAIVTMADDGGSSGMLRRDYGMLPPGMCATVWWPSPMRSRH